MSHDRFTRGLLSALLVLAAPLAARAAAPADGEALYKQRCAACHEAPGPASRAPPRSALASRSPADVVAVLTKGGMAPMAAGLSDAEIASIAGYLTGKPRPAASPAAAQAATGEPNLCAASPRPRFGGPRWNGWSPGVDNARFQPAPGLGAADAARLKVKWAFVYPGGVASQPTVAGGRVYVAGGSGAVYALDARTGCTYWRHDVKGGVRAALSVGPLAGPGGGGPGGLAVFVGDRGAGVHALDAATGREVWATKVETHPMATITGAPVLYQGRLYVPHSSSEEISTLIQGHQCCSFRGNVVALDASSGRTLWRTFVTSGPQKSFKNKAGVEMVGPAGGAIWSAPTIDPRRGVLYVATGDSYTDAPNPGSDAVMAMDLVTGKVRWSRQVTANDNYLVACDGQPQMPAGCPDTVGSDYDFGASPVLIGLPNGRSLVVAGQKSGAVIAFDPDRAGEIVWKTRIGMGGALGGVEWGLAADGKLVFAPIADPYTPKPQRKSGLYGLSPSDGRIVWSAPAPDADCATAPKGSLINICTNGLSAAATAIPGAVFAGSMDGRLRAYSARDGRVIWDENIGVRSFQPVNARDPVRGGTMNAGGPVVAGGMLFVHSGYSSINPAAPNLLLAYSVDGR